MPSYICTTCGVGYAETEAPREVCLICADERQYVNAKGQSWTTLEELQSDHVNELKQMEPGLTALGSKPAVAIGQRRGGRAGWARPWVRGGGRVARTVAGAPAS